MTVMDSKSEVCYIPNKDDIPDSDLRLIIELLVDKQDCHVVKITQTQRDGSLYTYYELRKNYR